MPELPEVETIRRGLDTILPGLVFKCVDIFYPGSVKVPSAGEFAAGLTGRGITATGRRGKYLLLYLDDGSVLVFHLRMTGRLVYSDGGPQRDRHTHIVFHFAGGGTLSFADVRKFGAIWLLPTGQLGLIGGLASLGPEPLSPDFHFPYLDKEVEKRAVTIKALLLDQRVIAGLGNIYADEILHRCGIRPDRPCRSLKRGERLALFHAVREVLDEAIAFRGTTMSDYRDAAGITGKFQNRLRVYRRHNEPCPRCGAIICRTVVAGRGTHYCPSCQR